MNKYKICVYTISKNEEKFVDRWVASMSEADLIVVADTGSTDHTVEKLKAAGVMVSTIHVDPWRFDVARNMSMDLIPDDFDICVCTDIDEIFEPGWREKLENDWKPEYTRFRYNYTHGFHADGTPTVTYLSEKIHLRHGFRWIYPVHEVLEYSGDIPDCYGIDTSIYLKHYPDLTKPRSSYLPLLELSREFFPEYDRNIHYLGREYMYYGQYDKAIETLTYHLSLKSAKWLDERSASMRYIANCYKRMHDYKNANIWLLRAIAEAPHIREPYIAMVELGYLEKDWEKVLYMVNTALKITTRSHTYLDQESSWGSTLYDYGAVACSNLKLYKRALDYAEKAIEKKPDDPRLISNRDWIKSKCDLEK